MFLTFIIFVFIFRKYDYENFLCTLLLKTNARSSAIAIRAFNVEIARLQDQVSNSQIGTMRFKFWEDAIEQCFSKTNKKIPNHPIILELNRIIQKNKFTKRYFLNLISSRKNIMLNNSFESIEQMESHAEKAVSSLYYLLLEGSDVRNVHADHAASHLGKAQGICQLLRGVPLSKEINLIALPQNLLTEKKVSHEDVIRGKKIMEVKEIAFKIATRANQHLEKVKFNNYIDVIRYLRFFFQSRSLSNKLSSDAKSVLLPATLVENYLQKLLQVDCDLFSKKLHAKNYFWIPKVWYKNLIKVY